jgi:hypothetical protein
MDEDVNGQVQGNSGLGIMAEALCEAIMHHAEIYSRENVAPTEVALLELEIADLTSSYHDMSKERTGVDIEFKQGPLPRLKLLDERHGEDPKDDEARAGKEELSQDEEVFLVDKWYVQVSAPMAFLEFARQRVGMDMSSPEEAARMLCKKDGWKPQKYPKGLIAVLDHDVQLCLG